MSIFSNFFKNNKTEVKTVPSIQQYNKDRLTSIISGGINGDFDLNKAELISTVYTCISILSNNVSRLPIMVYNDDGKNKVVDKNHYYYSTLRFKPNTTFSNQSWLSFVVSQLYFYGNAYCIINGKELINVNFEDVTVTSYGGQLWYLIENFEKPFRASEILHFKLLSKDGVIGLNPIQSIKSEINLQYKSEKTTDKLFSNNTFSTKVIESDLSTFGTNGNKNKLDEYLAKIQEEFSGAQNAGNIITVPPMYKLKELKLNPSDLNFLEIAQYTESSIAALFGIPTFLLGKSNSNYTNFEQQQLNFRNQVLGSITNIIKSELEAKLLTLDEKINGSSIEFDYTPLMDTDLTTKANAYKILNNSGALSPNEFRKAFNLERIDDNNMDKYYMQIQYQPLGTIYSGAVVDNNNKTE